MTLANFLISLRRVEVLLKQLGLLRQKGVKMINNTGVSAEFKQACLKDDYFAAYKAAIRNFDYDFLLPDESLFQFEFIPNAAFNGFPDIRYAFFQNPQEHRTYSEYLNDQRLISEDFTEEDIGEALLDEYEQFLIEQQLNLKSTSIRYDVDRGNYKPLIHSVAHIHIGHSNNIRIPCDKLLTPQKFVLFVIKHTNYYLWQELIDNQNHIILDNLSVCKNQCTSLPATIWENQEKLELFLT